MKTTNPTMTDEEIIRLYWERNERAIEETDHKYGSYLFTIAHNILNDSRDCEECVNDTYLGTWNRIPPTRPTVFQVFLSKIMRNLAVDRFRKNHAAKRIPSEMQVSLEELDECMIPSTSSAQEEYLARELAKILNDFLHALSSRAEFIFICRYYYGDSIQAIARMLGLGDNTVRRELSRIRGELKIRLEKEGYHHE